MLSEGDTQDSINTHHLTRRDAFIAMNENINLLEIPVTSNFISLGSHRNDYLAMSRSR